MRQRYSMRRKFVGALTMTILCGVVSAFYGCWFALSRLAPGSEVAGSLTVGPGNALADAAPAKDKESELSSKGKETAK